MVNKQTQAADAATKTSPTASGPWIPRLDQQPDFNPFANIETRERSPGATLPADAAGPAIRDPAVDTAPLQGMHDLSDSDSLVDVIADANAGGVDANAGGSPPTPSAKAGGANH